MNSINWYPGHMAKASREIENRIKMVDLLIEIRDARAPLATGNPFISSLTAKPKIILLAKADLADPKITKIYTAKLQADHTRVFSADLTRFQGKKELTHSALELLKEKREKEIAKGLKPRPVRALIVGIPNAGKSTLINRLANRKAARTGDTPGVTRAQQIIKVGNDFELFDTPGILWPKLERVDYSYQLALIGAIKETIIPLEDVFSYALRYLGEHYPSLIKARYPFATDDIAFCEAYAKAKHYPGEVDYTRVMTEVFHDIRAGRIGRVSWEYE